MTEEELEKEKCELLGIIQGKDKAIADLKKENARMRELLKTLSESIVMTADDTFWSLKEDVEKFLEEKNMKNIKQKKCKNCKGTGFIPLGEGIKGIKTCPVCKGTGKIETGVKEK